MDLFKSIGVITRVPFYFAGIVLYTVIVIPIWATVTLLMFVGIPIAYVKYAIERDRDGYDGYVKEIKGFPNEVGRGYRSLSDWLYR